MVAACASRRAEAGWPDQGLWTSTLLAGGGRPTLLASILSRALPVLEHGPVLAPGEPRGVLVARDAAGILAVNTNDRPVTAEVGGAALRLLPGQVLAGGSSR